MESWISSLLSPPLLIVIPTLGALLSILCRNVAARIAITTTTIHLLITLCLAYSVFTERSIELLLGNWPKALGIAMHVDGLTFLMLSITAVIGFAVSLYAKDYFLEKPKPSFWTIYLLLMGGINALSMSHDIFNIYVTLECVGLASVGLVISEQNAQTLNSAMRYLLAALLGSMLYLFGVAFLYHSFGSLNIDVLQTSITHSPVTQTAMALMMVGLMLKAAIFPLHFWLPAAHSSAPAPVSAVLSALVVKASLYLILRLWLDLFSQVANGLFSEFLSILGLSAIVWASIQALLQTRLKLLIAYSTIAQLGYLLQAFTLSVPAAWQGVIYIALSHALAKSAMFLAAGNIKQFSGHDRINNLNEVIRKLPLTMTAFALAGMSIMGLPPSSGFIGKWLLMEAALEQGRYAQALIMVFGGILAAAYIFKVIGYAFTPGKPIHPHQSVTLTMTLTALGLALLSVFTGFTAHYLLTIFEVGMSFSGVPS